MQALLLIRGTLQRIKINGKGMISGHILNPSGEGVRCYTLIQLHYLMMDIGPDPRFPGNGD
jgi:hypothetical protein